MVLGNSLAKLRILLVAPRYLRDDEEYWPFEGDDWPDEYVGAEGLR